MRTRSGHSTWPGKGCNKGLFLKFPGCFDGAEVQPYRSSGFFQHFEKFLEVVYRVVRFHQ